MTDLYSSKKIALLISMKGEYMVSSALNFFDGILYINLERRKDRKKNMEKELKKLALNPDKIFRIEGYYDELNGSRGCVYSHIQALDFALAKEWKTVLILEDDCIFIKDQTAINSYINNFFSHFKSAWDVFFLGTKINTFEETDCTGYVQIHNSLRAHAYAVNGSYMCKLRDHFFNTYHSMQYDLFFISSLEKALDRQWRILQKMDRWFAGTSMIAQQKKSFSDIEKTIKSQR